MCEKYKELRWDSYIPEANLKPHINIPSPQFVTTVGVGYDPRYTSHKTNSAWALNSVQMRYDHLGQRNFVCVVCVCCVCVVCVCVCVFVFVCVRACARARVWISADSILFSVSHVPLTLPWLQEESKSRLQHATNQDLTVSRLKFIYIIRISKKVPGIRCYNLQELLL